jgi:hypothetical protein
LDKEIEELFLQGFVLSLMKLIVLEERIKHMEDNAVWETDITTRSSNNDAA